MRKAGAILSQLEEPRLKGEDFRTQQVTRIESIVDADHVLIGYSDRSPELFSLFNDPRRRNNLIDQPGESPVRDRLSRMLDAFHSLADE
jgi:hypothetical protein